MGLLPATFLGISSIIGSGWLLPPTRQPKFDPPSILLGYRCWCHITIGTVLCRNSGALSSTWAVCHHPYLSHNRFFGFPFAIANWLGVVAVIGLEAVATIQYLINLYPHLATTYTNKALTTMGYSYLFMFFLYLITRSKLLTKIKVVSIIKLIVPSDRTYYRWLFFNLIDYSSQGCLVVVI